MFFKTEQWKDKANTNIIKVVLLSERKGMWKAQRWKLVKDGLQRSPPSGIHFLVKFS